MTTQKARLTVYLTSAAELDDLREQLRILAPLEPVSYTHLTLPTSDLV